MFEQQVKHTPQDCAIRYGDQKLTYHELDCLANHLAQLLHARGIKSDDLVGLHMKRSTALCAGVLGILKAGGCCLPLDIEFPPQRLKYMIADAQPKVIITTSDQINSLPVDKSRIIVWDDAWFGQCDSIKAPRPIELNPDHLAYVLYTSGSTGQPKGVAMPHRSLVNLMVWQRDNSSCGEGDNALQFAPIGFDVSFQEMFATWFTGGCLILVSEQDRKDFSLLLQIIEKQNVNRLFMPCVALQTLALKPV